jgi:hypothetical protein
MTDVVQNVITDIKVQEATIEVRNGVPKAAAVVASTPKCATAYSLVNKSLVRIRTSLLSKSAGIPGRKLPVVI